MLVSLLLALAPTATAAEPKFNGTTKGQASIEKPESKLTAELGGALTSGNSEFYVFTGGLNGFYRWNRSRFTLKGNGVIGRARVDADGDGTLNETERAVDMVPNAQRADLDLRYDFFLSKKDSLYAQAGAQHDAFAGINLRLKQELGYSRQIIDTDKTKLVGELGAAFIQEFYTPETATEDVQFLAARGMLGFSHQFADGVAFENTLVAYENLFTPEDLRLENNASLVTSLGSMFSLKLSHVLRFDNVPAQATFRKLDQTMTITLVASIL